MGDLEKEEIEVINLWKDKFIIHKWELDYQRGISRDEMFSLLQIADGLLLLSASEAPIPSKLFEYIPTMKPILAITSCDSAVWELGNQIPQMSLVNQNDLNGEKSIESLKAFIKKIESGNYESKIPDEFTDIALRKIFFSHI